MRTIASVSIGWLGISMIGDGVTSVLLPYQLLEGADGAATAVGLTTLVAIVLGAAVQPVAGRWSDHVGRWPVVLTGAAVACSGLALLLVPRGALVGTVLALVGASVAQAGYQPLLADRVHGERRGRGAGVKGLLDVGGAFVAFLLLAALLGAGFPGAAVAVLGIVLIVSLTAGFLLQRGGVAWRDERATESVAADATPLRAARSPRAPQQRSNFVALVVARFLFLVGIYVVGRFLLLFVTDRLGLEASDAAEQAGGLLALLALVSAGASLPSGWLADRLGRRPLMLAGGGLAALGIAALPAAGSVAALLFVGTCMALGSAAFSTGNWAALSDATAGRDAGRLLGLASLGTAGAAAAAGAFGLLIDAGNAVQRDAGYALAFELGAACALAGGLLAWNVVARTARNPVPAEAAD